MPKRIVLAILPLAALAWPVAAQTRRVALAADAHLDAPARYGLDKLRESLAARGFSAGQGDVAGADYVVVAGAGPSGQAARTLRSAGAALPKDPQAFVIRRTRYQGKPALILYGADARGLLYAALDAADGVSGVGGGAGPFQEVRDAAESPYLPERGVSMYTMHRAYFESRLHDPNYWKRYFDLLARSRINTFTVIFGYENGGFMAPPYPFFFDLPDFPQVRLVGITPREQARNAAAFRAMIRLANERGIDVIPAVWDHIYRGGVQGGGIAGASELAGKEVPGLVAGVTADNLAAYTKAALRRFLELFPETGGIEFRMHAESGLKRTEMADFWRDVFAMLARFKPGLRVTLRAKELPDSIIDDALRQGLNTRVETKYWMEQMGLPFHPTHVNRQNQHDRRHGYADLLRYPQRYRVHWRLWSGGTTRMLLWADPEYVRRFASSARLYGGNSFDVNEMLAAKMLGEPHDKPPAPLLTPAYRHSGYEFERYWHFYQVWGRVSYNPDTPPEVWEREFRRRFGAAGPALMRGLHTASGILPRIVASSYRYQLFPTTRGWAEMMRQGDLPEFAALEGTDIEQFQNPRDAARSLLSGQPTSKRRPEETSRWFARTADAVLRLAAEAAAAGASGNEARATLTDLRILAGLARYYAARLPAAVSYNLYRESGGPAAFDAAIEQERNAVSAWAGIVQAAGDVYEKDLAFGVHRVGFPRHWSEELGRLERGLEQLAAQRKQIPAASRTPASGPRAPAADALPPVVRLDPPGIAQPGRDLRVTARAADPASVASLRLRYRRLTQFEDYESAEMVFDGKTGTYSAAVPGGFITPEWDLMYFVEAIGKSGAGRNYPDLEREQPYVIVPVRRAPARGVRR